MSKSSRTDKTNKPVKKFSRTGLILVGCSLVCVILALAVGLPSGFLGDGGKGGDLDDENTPKLEDIMEGGNPLLVFDQSDSARQLMEAYDEGHIASVKIMYDQMGGNPELESDDQSVIKEAYKGLKNIVVGDATEETVTDSYHYVIFVLEGGDEISYSFEGDNLLCYEGSDSAEKGNYEIQNTGQLWKVYDSLAENR